MPIFKCRFEETYREIFPRKGKENLLSDSGWISIEAKDFQEADLITDKVAEKMLDRFREYERDLFLMKHKRREGGSE